MDDSSLDMDSYNAGVSAADDLLDIDKNEDLLLSSDDEVGGGTDILILPNVQYVEDADLRVEDSPTGKPFTEGPPQDDATPSLRDVEPSSELCEFLHHLSDLQRFHKLESEKLSKAKEKHACDREALEMLSRAHREVIQAQVHINHHGACASKELIETQANNTSLEQAIGDLLYKKRVLSSEIMNLRTKHHTEMKLFAYEQERMNRWNRETELYFKAKPEVQTLLKRQEEKSMLQEQQAESAAEGCNSAAGLALLKMRVADQKSINVELDAEVIRIKSSITSAQRHLEEIKERHVCMKKMLKEDRSGIIVKLFEVDAQSQAIEQEIPNLSRTVSELTKRLEDFNQELESQGRRKLSKPHHLVRP